MVFVDNDFRNYIKLFVLDKVFPILNSDEKGMLLDYLVQLIDYISVKYNFLEYGDESDFIYQFKQNGGRDILALLNLLLPFIDDIDGSKSKRLKNLNELYTKLKDGKEDKYEYTNIQFSRCIRKEDGDFDPIKYNREHTRHNFMILKKTIFKSANKSFVNWMNIFPMRPENITKFDIYNVTKKIWDNGDLEILDDVDALTCFLPFDDIYNTMVHYLYEDIKNIKWLIFERPFNGKSIPFVILLNKYVNLDGMLQDRKWDYLQDVDKKRFENGWFSLMNNAIDNPALNKLFKSFFITFQKSYQKIDELVDLKLFKKFRFLSDDFDDDLLEDDSEADKYHDVKAEQLIPNITLTPMRHIYEFIFNCIKDFKKTWFFFNDKEYLTKDKWTRFKDLDEDFHMYKIGTENLLKDTKTVSHFYITIKNIYNLSKSFHHHVIESRFLPISKYWRSVPYEQLHLQGHEIDRTKVINRLNVVVDEDSEFVTSKDILNNMKNISEWFSIKKYIRNTYGLHDDSQRGIVSIYNAWIFLTIKKKFLLNIIFEILTKKGILSYFKPSKELTDESLLPDEYIPKTKEIKKRMNNYIFTKRQNFKESEKEHEKNSIVEFEKAYYFLTDKPYKNLEKFREKGEKDKTYFEMVADEFNWQYTYAMDWMSQINFFNHYLNNRIIFVTGSTGVGKSSQVPKLLLYALKAIDYKSKGKVVCTQPRVPPTENVPGSIAEQMGVPLKNYSPIYDKDISTDNFQIQFKHQKNDHTDKNQEYYLKMVTDGTLFMELKNAPLGKKRVPMQDEYGNILKDENGNTINDHGLKNLYDIIIVDEAHEHNTNMDIILTVARYSAYYNNDIKLVIISATMDDDEPRYRRYFRCLNDNRSHPFDFYLKENNLDRINVDRRFHISPPGQTTRFRVDEYYESGLTDEQKTWDWAYERGLERVEEICDISSEGDILFFVTGKREILDAVKKLNKNTPEDVICLPYHGELSAEEKEIIENIHSKLKTITYHKDNVGYDEDNDDDVIDVKTVPPGTYKRAVIVATNVAEASLTIITLRYVVETGYAKTAKYNYKLRSSILETAEISESSRLQRKGRVGRVADGTVYYTYEKGDRENNITEFKISNGNIYNTVYDLLCSDYKETSIFTKEYDPNEYSIIKKFSRKANDYWKIWETEHNDFVGIKKMLVQQYFSLEELIDYYGQDDHCDWNFKGWGYRPPDYKLSGYSKETLLDSNCDFYLVNPDEETFEINDIRLSVTGQPKHKLINSRKMLDFFRIMRNQLLVVEQYIPSHTDIIIMYDLENKKYESIELINSVQKTEYGINLGILKSSLDIYESSDIVPYVYAGLYECREQVLNILCMINSGNFAKNMKKWFGVYVNDNKRRYYISEFKELYGNVYGDYIALANIYNLLKSVFGKLLVFREIEPEILRESFEKYKSIYNAYIKYDVKRVHKELPLDIFKFFKKLENKNVLNTDSDFDKFLEKNYSYLIDDIEKYKSEIIKYSETVYLNPETVILYLEYLAKQKYNIWYNDYKHEKNLREETIDKLINVDWFDNNLTTTYKTDNVNINIILTFMHAKGENIGYIINNSKYVQVLQKQILSIGKLIRFLDDTENCTKQSFTYIMYHIDDNRQFEEDSETTINIVNNIKLEWLFKLVPYIYDIKEINKNSYTITRYYEDNPNLVILIAKTLSEFKRELISYFPNIIENIFILANGPDDKINNYFFELANKYRSIDQLGGGLGCINNIIIQRKDKKYKYKLSMQNNKIVSMKKLKNYI